MSKFTLNSVTAAMLSLFLITACADESADDKGSVSATSAPQKTVMDQPVDFSSPENVEKSLEDIRQQAGERSVKKLTSAMDYMIFYDLEVKRDKDTLHKKLDGKTPNEIIAMVQRF